MLPPSYMALFMLIYLPLWCWALQPDVPAVESTSVGRWQRRRTSRLHHGSGSRRSTPTLSPLRTSRRSPLQMFLGTKCMQKWDGMEGTVADWKRYIYTFAVAFLESHLSLTPAIQPFFILAGLKGKTNIQRWNTLAASKHLSSFVPWGSAGRLEERCKMARSAKDL